MIFLYYYMNQLSPSLFLTLYLCLSVCLCICLSVCFSVRLCRSLYFSLSLLPSLFLSSSFSLILLPSRISFHLSHRWRWYASRCYYAAGVPICKSHFRMWRWGRWERRISEKGKIKLFNYLSSYAILLLRKKLKFCTEEVVLNFYRMRYSVLYSTVLYCTVLYCDVLYCTVLYCTVQYRIAHTIKI